jgi:CheY-like chemotaxis protein
VFFPLAADSAEASPEGPAKRSDWTGSGTVLLVDDEQHVRAVGRRMLERLGFEVLAACNGHEALDLFRKDEGRIRCVLLDLTMPGMDGEETFRELRGIDPNVRVVIISGYSEQEVVSRFSGQGLSGFIYKPFKIDSLATALKAALDSPEKH